jgi:hypothetical protein
MKSNIITLKVSFDKKIYRLLEIRSNKSLHDLAELIIKSFDFDFDHAFGFYNNIKNHYKSDEIYELFSDLPNCDPHAHAKGVVDIEVGDVFEENKKMLFLFDYGDEWLFLVECKKYSAPTPKARYPRIIEKVGKSPEQYPDYDED